MMNEEVEESVNSPGTTEPTPQISNSSGNQEIPKSQISSIDGQNANGAKPQNLQSNQDPTNGIQNGM